VSFNYVDRSQRTNHCAMPPFNANGEWWIEYISIILNLTMAAKTAHVLVWKSAFIACMNSLASISFAPFEYLSNIFDKLSVVVGS